MVAMTRAARAALLAPAALAALATTACLSTPAYEPPPSALTFGDDTGGGGGASVSAEGFVLHFAGGAGFHFPDVHAVDGTNIIGRDTTAPCYAEDGVGLVLFPTPRISALTGALVTTSQITATMRGPAVTQVRIDWSSQFVCSNNHPGGSSLYTVFLDGRIVRHDSLDDQTTAQTSSLACACDANHNQGFQIASYWTFNPAAFSTLTVPGSTNGPIPLPKDPLMPFRSPNFYVGCLDAGSYQVGFAWSTSTDVAGTPKIVATPTQVVFSRERTGGFVSTFDPLLWGTNDAVFVEHTGCKKALERASEHAQPSSLSVGGKPIAVSLVNGIYAGDPGQGGVPGKPGVKLPPGRVELTGPVGSSFAVWLQFTSGVDAVRAQLAGKTGAWYVLQRIDATSWIAWFRDPLMAEETIAIETL